MDGVGCTGSRLGLLLQGCGRLLSSIGARNMLSQGASSLVPTACFLGLCTNGKWDELLCQTTCMATTNSMNFTHGHSSLGNGTSQIDCSSGHALLLFYILQCCTLLHTHTHTHILLLYVLQCCTLLHTHTHTHTLLLSYSLHCCTLLHTHILLLYILQGCALLHTHTYTHTTHIHTHTQHTYIYFSSTSSQDCTLLQTHTHTLLLLYILQGCALLHTHTHTHTHTLVSAQLFSKINTMG